MSIQRIVLNINGVDREILCEPEKDSLADVVRRFGLTGTKVGCGTGHCGACSLLLDGEVTRSCVKKMKQVKAYAKVETIEGIGSAERLHPLQRAFMTYASVQCGFCSPGFIMSAKGLLMRNPDPTREEVREWFTRHGNVCRCTGYKPIVDAVMEAAAVMRGEKAMEAIRLVRNDTGCCPDTGSASGSRSHHVVGMATLDAASKLLAAMRKEDGTYRTWREMRDAGIPTRYRGVHTAEWSDIDPDTGHGYGAIAQNYVLFMAEVAVEAATGRTRVLGATIVADVGVIGSRQAVLGQAWGGFSHSIGFALSENYEDMKKHATMRGAGGPRCNDVPDTFNVLFHETYRENGPHGSTGCAEGFQSAGHVSILNAIADAVGVRVATLPVTPEKLKAAMTAKAAGVPYGQEPWDLGCSLYGRLAFLKARHAGKGKG